MNAETLSGIFDLPDNRRIFGSLRIAGKDSAVVLFDDREFPPVPAGYRYLTGNLHNGECVTLINCVLQKITHRGLDRENLKSSARLFPNVVVTGPRHVPRDAQCVSEIAISIRDAHSVFYDFDAFSTVLNPEPFVSLLKQDKAQFRPIEVGPHPVIGYFSGRFEIATLNCTLGKIQVRHRMSQTMGGPRGLSLSSQIAVSLKFKGPLSFKESMRRQHAVVRFFELIIGRKQALIAVEMRFEGQLDSEPSMRITEAYAPKANESIEDDPASPGPRDVLLCTADGAKDFCQVTARYFELDAERLDARSRLAGNLREGRLYAIDRLVSAANMFDILPRSAYPARVDLSDETERVRELARKEFRNLPYSIERDSILNALGRMNEMSLKRKVLYRLHVSGLQAHFQGIDLVLKEAVNCRNHYVHGSDGKINYAHNFDTVIFFTNALEFVFGVSDLVDCGWKFEDWAKGSPQNDHPFGEFRLGYRERFEAFETLLLKTGKSES